MTHELDIDYDDRPPLEEEDPREPDADSIKHDREVQAEQKREREN